MDALVRGMLNINKHSGEWLKAAILGCPDKADFEKFVEEVIALATDYYNNSEKTTIGDTLYKIVKTPTEPVVISFKVKEILSDEQGAIFCGNEISARASEMGEILFKTPEEAKAKIIENRKRPMVVKIRLRR